MRCPGSCAPAPGRWAAPKTRMRLKCSCSAARMQMSWCCLWPASQSWRYTALWPAPGWGAKLVSHSAKLMHPQFGPCPQPVPAGLRTAAGHLTRCPHCRRCLPVLVGLPAAVGLLLSDQRGRRWLAMRFGRPCRRSKLPRSARPPVHSSTVLRSGRSARELRGSADPVWRSNTLRSKQGSDGPSNNDENAS